MTRRLLPIALLAVGCMKTYVKRSSALSTDAALPALMVHTGVTAEQDSNGDGSLASLAVAVGDMAQNTGLDGFGESLVDAYTPFVQSQGLKLELDGERAKSLQRVDWGDLGNSLTVASGGWTEPRGAVMPLMPRTLFRAKRYEKVADALHTGSADEAFLYVVANVHKRGLLLPYPKLQLTFVAHDHTGKELLLAQGIGKGKRSFLITSRRPENLARALDAALLELDHAEPETLE